MKVGKIKTKALTKIRLQFKPVIERLQRVAALLREKARLLPGFLPRHRRDPHGCRFRIAYLWALLVPALVFYLWAPAGTRSAGEVFVRVKAGSGARAIGRELAAQGVVRSPDQFLFWVRLLGAQNKLQAGEYRLHPGMTPPTVVRLMMAGRVASAGVTIPEGYTLAQIAATLASADLVDEDEFLRLAQQADEFLPADHPLRPPGNSLEGYLFPDTYRIAPGTPAAAILRMMLDRTAEVVMPLLREAELPPDFGLHEVLTLASVVEEEAKVEAERPLIAGVFFNRLKRGMPLQSDPTVKYVLDPAPVALSREDIAIDSPYNTYRYAGLPPGPISNPGLASIKAVLYPAETEYLYFVARGDGTHEFTATYAEHLAARRRIASAASVPE